MLIKITNLFYFIASISYFLPLFVVMGKRRIPNSPLFLYIIINILSVSASYFFLIYFSNSFPIFHFSVLASTAVLFYYFKTRDLYYQSTYNFMIVLLITLFMFDLFLLDGICENNFYTTVFSNTCLTFFSLRQLFFLLNDDKNESLFFFESNFYIAISILILNSSSFFFSILESKIRALENKLFLFYTLPFFFVFILIHNVLLSVGLWKKLKIY
jgi:hypothetical protein